MARTLPLLILSLLISCSKNSDSGYKTSDIVHLKNSELFSSPNCFSLSGIHAGSGFLISDVYTYAKYADSMRIYPYNSDCDTATLRRIDFSKYSLIGIMTTYGDCDSLYRNFNMDDRAHKLRYIIDITQYGGPCNDKLNMSLNLALVPKLPNNYSVEFEVNLHN